MLLAMTATESTPPAIVEPAPTFLVRELDLGVGAIKRMVFTRYGQEGRVHELDMRIDQGALVRYMGASMVGGTVSGLEIHPVGPHDLYFTARAFGLPTRAGLSIGTWRGKVLMTIGKANIGFLPLSGKFLRDQILSSSEPAVLRNGDVRAVGEAGLAFEPDYLFAHILANFGGELQRRGMPEHLKVRLSDVSLVSREVAVRGGD
jgi:hypothetical protein